MRRMMRLKCKYITMSGKCQKHSTPEVNEYCLGSPCEDYEGYGTKEVVPRYIDADALIEDIKHGLWDWETVDGITTTTVLKQTIRDIQNMPTEVVFCKECKNRYTQWCGFYYKYEGKDGIEDYEWTHDDGFCSFGEWKIPEEIDEVAEK